MKLGLLFVQQQVADESAFDVQPKRIVVAPHDYAHATLSFKPTALQQYSSLLRIAVEKSANSLTGQAQFDLRGEGTLPSITLGFPTSVFQKDGSKCTLRAFDCIVPSGQHFACTCMGRLAAQAD